MELENDSIDLGEKNNDAAPITPPQSNKLFTEEEASEFVRQRRARDAEALRLKNEEIKRLKSKLENLEKKEEQGRASVDDMQQLVTAKQAIQEGVQKGYTEEELSMHVEMAMKQKELMNQLVDAKEKDQDFSDLWVKGNQLRTEEVMATAYLPNAPAVVKLLLKDKNALDTYRYAQMNSQNDNGIGVMNVLYNLSQTVENGREKPRPNQYSPATQLKESSSDSFNISDYVGSKY
jgi:hypothetical protein